MPSMGFEKSRQVFGLVDCNNFYASCERVFNPKLRGKPVVVLSNNDGCIIARSNEAKALGIKMGEPFFKAKPIILKHNVQVFSANFTLYGDLSRRVMDTLSHFSPNIEIYSIDEAFLDLSGQSARDLTTYGRQIRETVRLWTGVPVSIGIAETKTLAKIAGELAKKSDKAGGVLDLYHSKYQAMALERVPVQDVWGVGWKFSEKLHKKGIKTALQLRDTDDTWLMKNFSVVLMRTVHELRGVSCLPLELAPVPKKGIATTRSFGTLVENLPPLKEAVSCYAARTAEKLREDGLATQNLLVFIQTSRFRKEEPQYSNSITLHLPMPTNHTSELITAAINGLENIYKEGYRYHRSGVMALNLIPENEIQQNLLYANHSGKLTRLCKTLDRINNYYGSGHLRYCAEGMGRRWNMKQEKRSLRYTSCWNELATV